MTKWSDYQERIFAWPDNPNKTHLMVSATAGSGKTTTICELYRRIAAKEPSAKVQFLAFNKKIAVELESRGVPAGTMNSFGFRQVTRAFPGVKLDADKTRKICKENTSLPWNKVGIVTRAVSLMKSYLFPRNPEIADVAKIVADFDLCEEAPNDQFLDTIRRIFDESIMQVRVIDFDDQICFPHYHELAVAKSDYMIVDECQDLSPNKLELVSRGAGKHFICVGDPLQAIYGFCGADSESMNKIIERFHPKVMTLPVTYRCGKAIVAETHAMKVAPSDFQAGESNHEGEVRTVPQMQFEREVRPKDFVLCRANAPLITQCFNLIARGVRSMIIGRDVGGKLSRLADTINEKTPTNPSENDIIAFVEKMHRYEELEVAKLMRQDKEKAADALQDQLSCLAVFCQNSQSFAAMKAKIASMFDDVANPDAVIFSTIHKAKGLEAPIVWSLPGPKMGGKKGLSPKRLQEESNLKYVMITRAMKQFNWVLPEPDK